MMRIMDATVIRSLTLLGTTAEVRLERLLDHSPADVWAACTEPERVRRWLGELSGHRRPGSTVSLRMSPTDTATCRIEQCEAPHLLVCSWSEHDGPESEVRLSITGDGASTRLVLEHRRLPADGCTDYGAGWEDFLRALAEHLAAPAEPTAEVTWAEVQRTVLPHWRELSAAPPPA